MIRGYFSTEGKRQRPFVEAVFRFAPSNEEFNVPLLVDTGADRTILAPIDALRLALDFDVDLTKFEQGPPSTGVGGPATTRIVQTVLRIDAFETPLQLTILEPASSGRISPIPSLLGRDVISRFGLFIDQCTNRVLLLEKEEVGKLPFLV